jgi:putative MATE family efflux protein
LKEHRAVTFDETRNRTLQGSLGLGLLRFGTPLALGMGLQVTFNLVDAYMVSRLGKSESGAALGAIGICDQVAAIGSIISYGISTAAATVASHRFGANDIQGARRVAWQSTLLVVALGIVFALLGLFGAEWIMRDLVGAKGGVLKLGARYLRVAVGGNVTIFLLLHWTTLQRALGSSKTPVAFLLISNLLNFLFAVVLVYGPGPAPNLLGWGQSIATALHVPRLGLLGAAWATVIARTAVLAPLFFILFRRFGIFSSATRGRFDAALVTSIYRLAWPASTQLVVRILAMLLVQSLVARFYTTAEDQSATTALGVVFRLETMALFISLGWGSAAQTFVGQNLGAQQQERALQSGWLAAGYNTVMMLLLATSYVVFGRNIIEFFDREPQVVGVALSYLRVVTFSYIGLGIGIVLGSAIQSAGRPRLALATDGVVLSCVLIPALLLTTTLHLPITAVWYSVAASYCAFALAYSVQYARRGLLQHGNVAGTSQFKG